VTWLFAHIDALRDGARRLIRQPFATLLNVVVFGIALALPSGFYVGLDNLERFSRQLTSKPQLSLFLTVDATTDDAERIKERLQSHPSVERFRFVHRNDALDELKRASGMSDVLAELDANPLPHAFVVTSLSATPEILEALRIETVGWPNVEHVQVDSDWARKLDAALRIGKLLVSLLSILLAIALAAVTFNTIRLQILTRRDEIEVSKLIGATNSFIRRPFLYFGSLQGLLGGTAAWLIVATAVKVLNVELTDLVDLFGLSPRLGNMSLQQTISLLAIAALLGWVGAWMSVSRHLWQIDPH
jgi:cell division transport system permease protein